MSYQVIYILLVYIFAGNVYAETDLDQPTDYSLRYAEEDTEKPQTYCTEGTPYNFSTATSLSDLRSPDAANKVVNYYQSFTQIIMSRRTEVSESPRGRGESKGGPFNSRPRSKL